MGEGDCEVGWGERVRWDGGMGRGEIGWGNG